VPRLRVLVADDHPAALQGLISLLSIEFEVVASAEDGNTALDLIRTKKPEVAVLDLRMPGLSGLDITRELAKHPSSPPVVICAAETDSDIVQAALQAGALSFVFKARLKADLILAVKFAAQGKSFISPP